MENIKNWLIYKGVNSLWDLSAWNDNNWVSWDFGDLPLELELEAEVLINLLQGKSPLKEDSRDKRGWGHISGRYSASEGYKLFKAIPTAAPNLAIWNYLWTKAFIPKIDTFGWILAHKSVLSGENLKKRGMEGPTRCPLCKNEDETTDHLIVGCPYAREVWREALALPDFNLPCTTQALFTDWMQISPFSLSKKVLLQTAWRWIPKAICWKIWIERNN